MYDLLIQNATIIDGTGAPAFSGSIALQGGKIVKIGAVDGEAKETLDVHGLAVTPGFIDSHSHSDRALEKFPDLVEKAEQGITTAMAGQCGESIAPSRKGPALKEHLARLAEGSYGSNTALFIGHRNLRQCVMGYTDRNPNTEELEQMKALLREGIAAGAMGISFGLIYPPSCFAQTEELIALAKVAGDMNALVVAHIRNEGDTLLESVEEFISIIRASGARGVLSHHKSAGKQNWGKVQKSLAMMDAANEEGLDIYCDVYPYTASNTSLSARMTPQKMHAEGPEAFLKSIADPAVRKELAQWVTEQCGSDLSWIMISVCATFPEYEGKTLPEVAAMRNTDVFTAAYDVILESKNKCSAAYFNMCEEDMLYVMKHPRAMIGTDSSVAGDSTGFHPRLQGTFPRALRLVREKNVVPLPEMIRKMTGLPAAVYGLQNKGLIKEGYDADLCIFDPETVTDRADFGKVFRRAEGLHYVLINGKIVVENAVYNGLREGKFLLR